MPNTTDLARRIRVDLSTNTTNGTDGTWTQLLGITDANFPITPTKVDTTTYDTNGWKDFVVTLQEWSGSVKLNRQSNAGTQDPGQKLLTDCVGQFDPTNSLYVRWYDRSGKAEPSWYGFALVEQAQSKTGAADVDEDSFTFTGRGAATKITNPYAPTSAPVILSALPSGVSVGNQVTILGSGFTGTVATTGVKFGATNASSWIVESDSMIVAVMPAGSAGAANIVVTNATGASAAFSYTRGA